MADTSFSIELQGLNLPNDVTNKLQSDLRTAVMTELAKTDMGAQVSVEPLQQTATRSILPFRPPIMGFVIRNLGELTGLTERGMVQLPPATEVTMPPPALNQGQLLDGHSLTDVLNAVYYRPDVRAAITSNSQAFAQLLSQDEVATQVFNQLTAGFTGSATGTDGQKLVPLAIGAILLGCAVVGGVVGYLSRK
jgi:hypothetical protein